MQINSPVTKEVNGTVDVDGNGMAWLVKVIVIVDAAVVVSLVLENDIMLHTMRGAGGGGGVFSIGVATLAIIESYVLRFRYISLLDVDYTRSKSGGGGNNGESGSREGDGKGERALMGGMLIVVVVLFPACMLL